MSDLDPARVIGTEPDPDLPCETLRVDPLALIGLLLYAVSALAVIYGTVRLVEFATRWAG